MKLTVGTAKLQALLNKAVKGAGCNKLIPMTSLIAIQLEDGVLSLTTTDATNYLTVSESGVVGDNFYVAVQVELLSKLVAKMTCENVTLEVTDNSLTVTGNGEYKIELDLEDDGSLVKLPNPAKSFERDNQIGKVDATVILTALMAVKPALATTMDYPWFTCYYVKDSITGTDTYTVADYKKGFFEEPQLISPVVMDLLGLFTGEITVYAKDNKMLFVADGGTVYGAIPNGIDHYSIDAIKGLVTQEFEHSCKIVKSSLLSLLDRILLFVGEYDNGKITLNFGAECLEVDSKYANEAVSYTDNSHAGEFVCQIDANSLAVQVRAQAGDEIIIEYGKDNAIKLIDGDITSVVALLEE